MVWAKVSQLCLCACLFVCLFGTQDGRGGGGGIIPEGIFQLVFGRWGGGNLHSWRFFIECPENRQVRRLGMSDNKVDGIFQVSSATPLYYQTTVSLSVLLHSSFHLLLGMIHIGCCVSAPPLMAGLSAISMPGVTGNITQLPSSKTTSTCLEGTLTFLGVIIIYFI